MLSADICVYLHTHTHIQACNSNSLVEEAIVEEFIKGSLDEKLPSYEVLKMRENRCLKNRCLENRCLENRCLENRCLENTCQENRCLENRCLENRCLEIRCLYLENRCQENRCQENRCIENRCMENRCLENRCQERIDASINHEIHFAWQLHQIMHLARKMNLMIDPPHL